MGVCFLFLWNRTNFFSFTTLMEFFFGSDIFLVVSFFLIGLLVFLVFFCLFSGSDFFSSVFFSFFFSGSDLFSHFFLLVFLSDKPGFFRPVFFVFSSLFSGSDFFFVRLFYPTNLVFSVRFFDG